ncbi:MAG: hypothetical protein ACLGP3_10440 [Acidobacteriota bacterium]
MRKPLAQFVQDDQGNWDEQALLSIVGVLGFWFCVIWSVVKLGQHFDAQAVGIGFGAVMGATLGGLAYREKQGARNAARTDSAAS